MKTKFKIIHVLFIIFTFLYASIALAKTENGLILNVICAKSLGLTCPQNKNDFKQNYLILNNVNVQCVTENSYINNQKSLIIYSPKDNMVDVFSGKISKNDTVIKNPNYNKRIYSINFKLTDSAGNQLFQLTKDYVGHFLELTYNKKLINKVIIQSPLSNNFTMTLKENIFKDIVQELNLQECATSP